MGYHMVLELLARTSVRPAPHFRFLKKRLKLKARLSFGPVVKQCWTVLLANGTLEMDRRISTRTLIAGGLRCLLLTALLNPKEL